MPSHGQGVLLARGGQQWAWRYGTNYRLILIVQILKLFPSFPYLCDMSLEPNGILGAMDKQCDTLMGGKRRYQSAYKPRSGEWFQC